MSPGRTTQRIIEILKAQVVGSDRRPGEHLDPGNLARELEVSTTPVRDALHQLLGERLVAAWPRAGFQVPVPTETSLRDLYAWNGDLVALALRGWRPAAIGRDGTHHIWPKGTDDRQVLPVRALFDGIARQVANPELRLALDQASDRLHRARMVEPVVFADHPEEHAILTTAWSHGAKPDLLRLMARYHRRRQAEVARIAAAILNPHPSRN